MSPAFAALTRAISSEIGSPTFGWIAPIQHSMQDFSQPTEGNLDRKIILPGDADSCQWIACSVRKLGEQTRLDSLAGCGKTRFEADAAPRNALVSTAQPDKKKACAE